MEIREIKKRQEYNDFVSNQNHSQFLQSWEWGDFQVDAGFSVLRLGVFDGDDLRFATTLIKKKLLSGKSYYYCPRIGIKNLNSENLKLFFEEIRKISSDESVVFLRIEPMTDLEMKNQNFVYRKTINVQPSRTMILDLTKSEDELLTQMHSKTRYNIRLAKRKGVEIEEVSLDNFREFWKLMEDTGRRDSFRLHGREYYKKMLGINGSGLRIKLFFARHMNEIIAANIVSYFGNMVTYVHGASSNKHRNVMAPYLLQWHLIKNARDNGYKSYDFYGIGEGSLAGVTRFKKGFSGTEIEYPGTFDVVFDSKWYALYTVLRKVKRFIK